MLHLCSVANPITILGTIHKYLVPTGVLFNIGSMSEDAKKKTSGNLIIILNPPFPLLRSLFFFELKCTSYSGVCKLSIFSPVSGKLVVKFYVLLYCSP